MMIDRTRRRVAKQPAKGSPVGVSSVGCVDLASQFGHKYRIGHDPAYFAEHGEQGRKHDPWLLTIPCRYGEIFPQGKTTRHGANTLAASTNCRGRIARALMKLSCCSVHQDASDGVTVLFDAANISQVAKLLKPRGLRRLSPEHKAKLLAASRPFARKPASGAPGEALEIAPIARSGPNASSAA